MACSCQPWVLRLSFSRVKFLLSPACPFPFGSENPSGSPVSVPARRPGLGLQRVGRVSFLCPRRELSDVSAWWRALCGRASAVTPSHGAVALGPCVGESGASVCRLAVPVSAVFVSVVLSSGGWGHGACAPVIQQVERSGWSCPWSPGPRPASGLPLAAPAPDGRVLSEGGGLPAPHRLQQAVSHLRKPGVGLGPRGTARTRAGARTRVSGSPGSSCSERPVRRSGAR